MSPLVSILICTRNRADSLRQTLRAFHDLNVPADLPAELLVIDNASTDSTPAVVRENAPAHIPTRLIPEPTPGQVHARNTGLRESRGDVILFTDDDVRPCPDWIEGMARPIVAGRADAVAGGVRLAPHLLRPWMNIEHRRFLAHNLDIHPDNPVILTGANMAFHRRVLSRVPGFDPRLGPGTPIGFGDDTLFSQSLVRAGYRVLPAWAVQVEHHPDPSRLSRAAYLSTAERAGRTTGYIMHHVDHATHPFPRLRLLKHQLTLAFLRFRRPSQLQPQGIPWWESALLQKIGCMKQTLAERNIAPRYDASGLPAYTSAQPHSNLSSPLVPATAA